MVFDGQSLLNSPVAGVAPVEGIADDRVPYINACISGTTFAQRATTVVERVDGRVKSYSGKKVYINLAGYSDIVGGMTGAAAAAAAIANAQARKAAGFSKCVEMTQPHNAQMTSPQNTERLAYNAAILASSAFDFVVDLASVSVLQDGSNTTYFSDGLHFTQAGADAVVAKARPEIWALLPLGV